MLKAQTQAQAEEEAKASEIQNKELHILTKKSTSNYQEGSQLKEKQQNINTTEQDELRDT